MQQWQIDVFFQFSEAAHLHHKEATKHHRMFLERNLLKFRLYRAVKLSFPSTLPPFPPCLPHHIYLHLHKSSVVPVLSAFSTTAVSSQLWTAAHNTSINMFNSLQVPVEAVTLTGHCAGETVGLWVGLNTPFELHCNCPIYNRHKMWEFSGTFFWINYEALQIIKLVEYQTSPSQPHVSHLIVSFPSNHIPSLYISLSIPINNKPHTKLSMLMSLTLTNTQAVQHCSYCSRQSFYSTDIWDFWIQNVAVNMWVKTDIFQLLSECEGMKLEKRHKSTDYYLSQYVKLISQLHAAANLPPVH